MKEQSEEDQEFWVVHMDSNVKQSGMRDTIKKMTLEKQDAIWTTVH